MNIDLEKLLRKNVYELEKQNKKLMIRIKELNEELYELKTNKKDQNNKKYTGWVENPDASHIKNE